LRRIALERKKTEKSEEKEKKEKWPVGSRKWALQGWPSKEKHAMNFEKEKTSCMRKKITGVVQFFFFLLFII
jgi:hypothetical protein